MKRKTGKEEEDGAEEKKTRREQITRQEGEGENPLGLRLGREEKKSQADVKNWTGRRRTKHREQDWGGRCSRRRKWWDKSREKKTRREQDYSRNRR